MLISESIEIFFLSCLATMFFIQVFPSRWQWCRDLSVAFLIGTTALYTCQRYAVVPAFEFTRGSSYWQWSFGILEGIALVYEMWSFWVLRRISNHSLEADRCESLLQQLPKELLPSVAIFFPTYREPIELVMASLESAMNIQYRGVLTICCLDDGGHPAKEKRLPDKTQELREFCEANGIRYFCREGSDRGKAGNLTYAYDNTTEQIIVVLDCDFKVNPEHFLTRVVGLLHEHPEVGIVQVPQSFSNPDPVAAGFLSAQGICDAQASFMRNGQPGRDYYGNAFCVGSGWGSSRSVMDKVGGFSRLVTVGEDLELTYHLSPKGYRTLYLNEVLSFGLSPEGLSEYWSQMCRWCLAGLQQLFLPTGPIRGKLRFIDRLFYLDPALFWLTHLFTVQLLLAPVVLLFTGTEAIPDPDGLVLTVLAPRLAIRAILQYWLTNQISLPLVSALPKVLASIPVSLAILRWACVTATTPFNPTAKWAARPNTSVQWPMFWIFSSITLLILAGIVMTECGTCHWAAQSGSALNYLWAAGSAIVCFLAAVLCIEVPSTQSQVVVGQTVQEGRMGIVMGGILRRMFSLRV